MSFRKIRVDYMDRAFNSGDVLYFFTKEQELRDALQSSRGSGTGTNPKGGYIEVFAGAALGTQDIVDGVREVFNEYRLQELTVSREDRRAPENLAFHFLAYPKVEPS